MTKYQKSRLNQTISTLSENWKLSDFKIIEFLNRKNICAGRGRTIMDLINEEEFGLLDDIVESVVFEK